jgi:nicotinamidase-related amidase
MMAHYGLPHCGTSGSGMGWGPDLIAAGHQWMNHLLSCMGKVGLVPFVGDNLGAMAFSPAIAVYANDIIQQVRLLARGFELNDETVGLDEIAQVGPGGDYLTVLELAELIEEVGGPHKVAVMAVDVTVGFCAEGALSSERVGRIVEPIARLFTRAYELGVRHFVLPQDTHSPQAIEFGSFPPHCVRGSAEAQTMPRLQRLPFSELYHVVEKDSVSVSLGTGLDDWLAAHPEVTTFLVVGDCTDFCTHQLAMHLRLRANVHKLPGVRVLVIIEGVDTFDIPVDLAVELGTTPHHADLIHRIFLLNMAQNGIEIVTGVV